MMVTLKNLHRHYCLLCQKHKCRGPVHSEKPGVLKAMVTEYVAYTMQVGGNTNSILLVFTETKSYTLSCSLRPGLSGEGGRFIFLKIELIINSGQGYMKSPLNNR